MIPQFSSKSGDSEIWKSAPRFQKKCPLVELRAQDRLQIKISPSFLCVKVSNKKRVKCGFCLTKLVEDMWESILTCFLFPITVILGGIARFPAIDMCCRYSTLFKQTARYTAMNISPNVIRVDQEHSKSKIRTLLA